MKHFLISTILFVIAFSINGQTINFATYNLRNENTSDIGNLWKDRYPYIVKLVVYHDFDIFGTQEALPSQLKDLQQSLPQFAWYGEGRDGNGQGEHSAIYYKTDKYTLIDKGDFWLSATPNIPSKSWDAPCCNRICTWIKLKDQASGKLFFVFNAHYDYEKEYARNQSSLLILEKIKSIAGDAPVIFMGDLNGDANQSWCKILNESGVVRDSYFDIQNPYDNGPSFNAWGKRDGLNDIDDNIIKNRLIIDHVYLSKHFKTQKWGLLTDTYDNGRFPSDHFPILVTVSW